MAGSYLKLHLSVRPPNPHALILNSLILNKKPFLESCIVLIQITKEFGNDTVPFYQGQYLPTVRLPESVQTTWENVIGALAAVRLQCVKLRKQPGWTDIEGVGGRKAAIVLLIPARSEMAMDWASIALRNGNSKVDATNATASS